MMKKIRLILVILIYTFLLLPPITAKASILFDGNVDSFLENSESLEVYSSDDLPKVLSIDERYNKQEQHDSYISYSTNSSNPIYLTLNYLKDYIVNEERFALLYKIKADNELKECLISLGSNDLTLDMLIMNQENFEFGVGNNGDWSSIKEQSNSKNQFSYKKDEWYNILIAVDSNLSYKYLMWQESNPKNLIYLNYDLSNYKDNFNQNNTGSFRADFVVQSISGDELISIDSLTIFKYNGTSDIFEKSSHGDDINADITTDIENEANNQKMDESENTEDNESENFNDVVTVDETETLKYENANDYEKYHLAVDYFNNGDYQDAYKLLNELNGYSTSQSYLDECVRLLEHIIIDNDIVRNSVFEALDNQDIEHGNSICIYQAEKIEILNLSGCRLQDLEFIQSFTSLKELNLDNNAISDLTPLKDLYELESLSLACNCISDLTPLYNLSKLQYLNLSSNVLYEINALGNLKNLKKLDLSLNNIYSTGELWGLEKLESVDLSYNFITSVSGLNASPIKELNIVNTDINDLSAVARLSELEELKAGFVYVWKGNTDSYLTTVKYEKDVHFFMGLTGLDSLAGHQNLKTLYLARLQDRSLEPLTTMPNLESLRFKQYEGSDNSEFLARLVNLKELSLDVFWWGFSRDVSFLSNLINLEKLEIEGGWCKIDDFSIISNLANLKELRLSQCGDNLSFLSKLKNLELLKLTHWEGIDDFSSLLELDNIEYLEMENCNLYDFSIVLQMEKLKHLKIYDNEINSLEGIGELKNLEYLRLIFGRDHKDYTWETVDPSLLDGLDNLKYAKIDIGHGDGWHHNSGEREYREYPVGDRFFQREIYFMWNVERLNNLPDFNGSQDLVIAALEGDLLRNEDGRVKLIIPPNIRNLYVFQGSNTKVEIELDCQENNGLERVVFGVIDISEGGDGPYDMWGGGKFILENLDGLAGCDNLREIYINDAEINDISGLESCEKLKIVQLRGNNITDISSLADKIYLKELDLSDNDIESVGALENCIRLQTIELGGNRIKNLKTVRDLPWFGK